MERRIDAPIEELLRHEDYTPEELSRLLGIGLDVIRHAAFSGELAAQMAGHDIIRLSRRDVLAWLKQRDDRESTPRASRRA
jgi:excisionase family DNA binding protein